MPKEKAGQEQKKVKMTLELDLGEAWPDAIRDEYLLVHSIERNTIEGHILVDIEDTRGRMWRGEKTIKLKLRRRKY